MYYAYTRVSHAESVISDISLPTQQADALRYFDALPDPDKKWGDLCHPVSERQGFFVDRATSAYKKRLFDRPSGGYLQHVLKPGDNLIFWKLDRGFRSVYDFSKTVPEWTARGISLHFINDAISLDSANGRLMGNILASFAQWKSEILSERGISAAEARRANSASSPPQRKKKDVWVPAGHAVVRTDLAIMPDRIPGRIFSYGRRSRKSSTAGSLESQQMAADGYSAVLLVKRPELHRSRHLADDGVSAFQCNLRERPAGAELDGLLQRGDHVVFARLDRAWRDVRDMLETWDNWAERGVTVHFADLNVDTSGPQGRMMASIMAAIAEWESQDLSHRIRLAMQACKAQGRPVNQEVPLGFKVSRAFGKKWFVPDEEQVEIMERVIALRDQGMTWPAISDLIERESSQREGRRYVPLGGLMLRNGRWIKRKFGLTRLHRYCSAYRDVIVPMMEDVA